MLLSILKNIYNQLAFNHIDSRELESCNVKLSQYMIGGKKDFFVKLDSDVNQTIDKLKMYNQKPTQLALAAIKIIDENIGTLQQIIQTAEVDKIMSTLNNMKVLLDERIKEDVQK